MVRVKKGRSTGEKKGSEAGSIAKPVSPRMNKGGKPWGQPFVKGDPRINRNGRPKTFDQLRQLAQDIAHEIANKKTGQTVAENILAKWAKSKWMQKHFLEVAFGKVPVKVQMGADPDQEPVNVERARERLRQIIGKQTAEREEAKEV